MTIGFDIYLQIFLNLYKAINCIFLFLLPYSYIESVSECLMKIVVDNLRYFLCCGV